MSPTRRIATETRDPIAGRSLRALLVLVVVNAMQRAGRV
jgi:hypothetical protein